MSCARNDVKGTKSDLCKVAAMVNIFVYTVNIALRRLFMNTLCHRLKLKIRSMAKVFNIPNSF